ncbi:hypothetical protein ACFPRL_08260 [Pseudoclavibacter helvolus]
MWRRMRWRRESSSLSLHEAPTNHRHRRPGGASRARERAPVPTPGGYSSSASSLGSSNSFEPVSSTLTSLNVSTRTCFTKRSER